MGEGGGQPQGVDTGRLLLAGQPIQSPRNLPQLTLVGCGHPAIQQIVQDLGLIKPVHQACVGEISGRGGLVVKSRALPGSVPPNRGS